MIEDRAGELAKADPAALAKIRSALAKLKSAWPAPIPPPAPVLPPEEISALVADIERSAASYR
jgi:hypothetical protein